MVDIIAWVANHDAASVVVVDNLGKGALLSSEILRERLLIRSVYQSLRNTAKLQQRAAVDAAPCEALRTPYKPKLSTWTDEHHYPRSIYRQGPLCISPAA